MLNQRRKHLRRVTTAARVLGWTSLGIGVAEIVAPRTVQHLLGLEDRSAQRGVVRVLGVREVIHGVSILAEDRPSSKLRTALWSRVAGDVLDTTLLGVAGTKTRNPVRFAAIAAVVGAIGAADLATARRL